GAEEDTARLDDDSAVCSSDEADVVMIIYSFSVMVRGAGGLGQGAG
ncbi:hypothetical protein THAOC_19065, partial [Thalassiosira oceanica]